MFYLMLDVFVIFIIFVATVNCAFQVTYFSQHLVETTKISAKNKSLRDLETIANPKSHQHQDHNLTQTLEPSIQRSGSDGATAPLINDESQLFWDYESNDQWLEGK